MRTGRCVPSALAATAALAVLAAGAAGQEHRSRCGAALHAEEATGFIVFPQDELFCPLIGDPKQPRSFASLLRGEFRTLDDPDDPANTTIAAVGLGDRVGLFRANSSRPGDGLQLDLAAGIFAQFDFGTPSVDLINADYVIGLPLALRRAGFTTRLRFYHQSSHLGDEYLLRDDGIERENLSFESIELILSQEAGPLRLYAGGEHLFRREPETLDARLVHLGLELRSGEAGAVRFVAGADVKLTEEQEYSPAWSGRAGIQIARAERGGHPVRLVLLLAEFYSGPSPYGQFFQDDIQYAGVGIHIQL
jgi:Protein of unknown function (DUF1207)